MTSPTYLIRFDYPRVRGWQVRLPEWHPKSMKLGHAYTEFFSDGRAGGERGAHKAASARRDELMEGVPTPATQRPLANTAHARSSTGLVGIKLGFRAGRVGEAAFSWRVVWQGKKPKGTRRRSFAVATYGFEGALRKAIEVREKHTGLEFTKEQRATALALHKHVVRYCRTGKRPIFEPLLAQQRAKRKSLPRT